MKKTALQNAKSTGNNTRTFGAKSTKSVGRCDSPHTPQRKDVPGTLSRTHRLR